MGRRRKNKSSARARLMDRAGWKGIRILLVYDRVWGWEVGTQRQDHEPEN
jgi:hypothetical protein